MPQEMSFAQALTEARQIIVQQSNRIKADLDRIKSMQETITSQTATIAEGERNAREMTATLAAVNDQLKHATSAMDEMKLAKEQGEAVIDRQGQRLTQMQDNIAGLEKHIAEQAQKIEQLTRELEAAHHQLPTHEDTEALAALASLLSAKKGGNGGANATMAA